MTIAQSLECIRSKARWLSYYSRELAMHTNNIAARRSYETNAEDAMAIAEVELTEALHRVRQARAEYAAKAINDKAA